MNDLQRVLWTAGFGERSLENFIDLLDWFSIDTVLDLRMFPAFSHHRHFQKDTFREHMNDIGIEYHCAGHHFGGLRDESDDSPHVALDKRMRGFAEYMSTHAFRQSVEQLISLTEHRRIVIVDEQPEYEKCHRKLLADYLYLIEGFRLYHILEREIVQEHSLTYSARVEFNSIVYDNFRNPSYMFH